MSLQTILNPFTNRLQYVWNPAGTVIPVAEGGTWTSIQFTTWSVIFAWASGVYTQDNAKFFWDDTNDRLGIWTATPNYPLQIAGSIAGNLNVMSVINTRWQANDSVTLIFGVSSWLTNEAGSIRVTRTNSPNNWDSTIDIRNQKSWVLSSSLFADTAWLVGIGTTAPTHSLTLPSTSTGIAFHDAADQTSTLMERWKISWNAGLFEIRTDIGSAVPSVQNMQLVVSNSTWGTKTDLTLRKSTTPFFDVWSSSASATGDWARFFSSSHTMTSSSGEQRALAITHWVTQTWWANYISLFINITENSVGSWANALIKAQVGWVTKMSVDNNWWLLNARVIVASWTTTPVTITAAESNKVYTNEGATAKIVYNLPTAVAGLTYTFIVQDTDWMDITAAAWDTIRRNTNVTAAWGTVTSTAIGSVLTLVAINATEWIATSEIWTWA